MEGKVIGDQKQRAETDRKKTFSYQMQQNFISASDKADNKVIEIDVSDDDDDNDVEDEDDDESAVTEFLEEDLEHLKFKVFTVCQDWAVRIYSLNIQFYKWQDMVIKKLAFVGT